MPFRLPIVFDRRLVLFPQGQPEDTKHQDRCLQLAIWCGGDLQRVIDAPVSSVEAFGRYLSHIATLCEGEDQALVVLTKTNPLALTVVDFRRQLELEVPALRTARWVIYHDAANDPFFEDMALRLGHLNAGLSEAPVWTGPMGMPFLVVSSELRDRDMVCSALGELDEAILSRTGERFAVR